MLMRKRDIPTFKDNYMMVQGRRATMLGIANDLNRNYGYIRQVFSFRSTSYRLAKEICDLANMRIEELFDE